MVSTGRRIEFENTDRVIAFVCADHTIELESIGEILIAEKFDWADESSLTGQTESRTCGKSYRTSWSGWYNLCRYR